MVWIAEVIARLLALDGWCWRWNISVKLCISSQNIAKEANTHNSHSPCHLQVKLPILPQKYPTLLFVSTATSPSKKELSSTICMIWTQIKGEKRSVQDVISTTLGRWRLTNLNLHWVGLYLQILSQWVNNRSSFQGHTSTSVQITPVAQPVVSRYDIWKAVSEAQRHGMRLIMCRK